MNEVDFPKKISIEFPENKWERILYINNVLSQLQDMSGILTSYRDEIAGELVGDESDPKYHVVESFEKRKTTVVDEEGLKRDLPKVWRECLVIKPNEAAKIIGMDKLWALCLKYGGEERTIGASKITLEQMKKVMTDEEYKKYTTEIHKVNGLEVVEK